MMHLGLVNLPSFSLNLMLLPVVLAGVWLGRRIVAKVNQSLFENLALGFSALAALELIFKLSSFVRLR
jgi:uncharacterized membrane protein YfcA